MFKRDKDAPSIISPLMIAACSKKKPDPNRMKIRHGPDGTHIFDRSTGTNLLLNEKIPHLNSWTNSPRQVSIALTNACDLSCVHCYAAKKPANLKKESVKRWMLELDSAGSFGIGFGGGEPTLHPDIVEICQFGQERTNLAMSMTTHGHRLTPKLIAQLKPFIHFLRVSMDGVNSTYENIRGRPFSDLLEKFELLKGQIPFGINYVVNRQTIKDLSTAAEIAATYGATELLLLPEEGVGLGNKIDPNTIRELQLWVEDYSGDLRLSISASHQSIVNTQIPLTKELTHLAFVHIDAEGVLKESSFDKSGLKVDDNNVLEVFERLSSRRELIA